MSLAAAAPVCVCPGDDLGSALEFRAGAGTPHVIRITLSNSLAASRGPTGQLGLELTVESKFGFRLALIIEKACRLANQPGSWI